MGRRVANRTRPSSSRRGRTSWCRSFSRPFRLRMATTTTPTVSKTIRRSAALKRALLVFELSSAKDLDGRLIACFAFRTHTTVYLVTTMPNLTIKGVEAVHIGTAAHSPKLHRPPDCYIFDGTSIGPRFTHIGSLLTSQQPRPRRGGQWVVVVYN